MGLRQWKLVRSWGVETPRREAPRPEFVALRSHYWLFALVTLTATVSATALVFQLWLAGDGASGGASFVFVGPLGRLGVYVVDILSSWFAYPLLAGSLGFAMSQGSSSNLSFTTIGFRRLYDRLGGAGAASLGSSALDGPRAYLRNLNSDLVQISRLRAVQTDALRLVDQFRREQAGFAAAIDMGDAPVEAEPGKGPSPVEAAPSAGGADVEPDANEIADQDELAVVFADAAGAFLLPKLAVRAESAERREDGSAVFVRLQFELDANEGQYLRTDAPRAFRIHLFGEEILPEQWSFDLSTIPGVPHSRTVGIHVLNGPCIIRMFMTHPESASVLQEFRVRIGSSAQHEH